MIITKNKYIQLRQTNQHILCDLQGISEIDSKILQLLIKQPTFEIDYKQEAIACDLNTYRETICRRLKKLAQKGLVKIYSSRPTGVQTITLNLEVQNASII